MPLNVDTISTGSLSVNGTEITSSYKVYTALLTQSGTDAPAATVLENTLGGEVVWTRINAGEYIGTLIGAFPINKTWSTITTSNFGPNSTAILGITNNGNDNQMYISTVDPTIPPYYIDDYLYNTSIEIRVYN